MGNRGLSAHRACVRPAVRSAYLPLLALLPGIAFMGMQRVCGGPVLRSDRPGRIVWINVLSLTCNVALNLWWIPLWGSVGAAFASTCSYAFGALLFLRWTAKIGDARFPGSVVPRPVDASDAWRRPLGARAIPAVQRHTLRI